MFNFNMSLINNTLNHVNFDYKEYQQSNKLACGIQSKDWDENQLILNSNLGQTRASVKTKSIYRILSSKLKSNNLSIKLNNYGLNDRTNQEAPCFSAG